MSDTPRTDANIRGRTIDGFGRVEWVEVDLARTLERELTAARAEIERLKGEIRESFMEGRESYLSCPVPIKDYAWNNSRAKRISEGKE
jgi:hypothetical protein